MSEDEGDWIRFVERRMEQRLRPEMCACWRCRGRRQHPKRSYLTKALRKARPQ